MQRLKILSLLLIFGFSTVLFSQPKITAFIYGGYSMPAADMNGEYPDSLGLITRDVVDTYLLSGGFNAGVGGKYVIDSTGSSRLTAGLNYSSFGNTKNYKLTGGRSAELSNKMTIITLSGGFEYSFTPKQRVSPFLGIELTANFFGGKIEFTGDSVNVRDRKSESRFGIQLSGGAEVKLSKNIGVVLGIKYNMANMIGRSRGPDSTVSTRVSADDLQGQTSEGNEVPLNDKESTYHQAKVINYFQFYIGLSYLFGDR